MGIVAATGLVMMVGYPPPHHRPNPEERAIHQHYVNSVAEIPDLAKYNSEAYDAYFERRNNRSLIELSQVVSVRIVHTVGGKQCKIADPTDCTEMPTTVVIELTDIDGNKSSIWTSGDRYDKTLSVTGISPY